MTATSRALRLPAASARLKNNMIKDIGILVRTINPESDKEPYIK
ncbi:hypothetical protein [Desulfogranum mediterraneum]|nr:hypothetical protein [Desulfogranum mediterraneum]